MPTMNFSLIILTLRGFEVLFSVITFACLLGGFDICLESLSLHETLKCEHKDASYFVTADKLGGQIFILFVMVVFVLNTVALSLVSLLAKDYRRVILEVINASLGAALHIICFSVELWYSLGYGTLGENLQKPIKSFAAAAAFLFFNILICGVDAFLTWRKL